MKNSENYKPRIKSFSWYTILTLFIYGEMKNEFIREEIGMNEAYKNNMYSDRSSYYFDIVARRLRVYGIIERTKIGYYKLTKKGEKLASQLIKNKNAQ